MTKLNASVLLIVLASVSACSKEPPAPLPPESGRPAAPAGMRPMTSRDGSAAPASDADASQPPGSLPAGHPPIGGGESVGRPAAGGSISGTVVVAPKLQGRQSGAALFLIARNPSTKQIVAVRKEQVPQFPFEFAISAADAMVQGTAFEGPLDLTARLSRTGDAMPGSGDVEGTAHNVAVGATKVTITLDSVRQ